MVFIKSKKYAIGFHLGGTFVYALVADSGKIVMIKNSALNHAMPECLIHVDIVAAITGNKAGYLSVASFRNKSHQ